MVGISDYKYLPKLNNAVNDAKAIKTALLKFGIERKDIVACFDGASFELFPAFEKFVAGCHPGDFVIIFFAGHGCAFKNHQCLLARGMTQPEKLIYNNGNPQLIMESALKVNTMIAELRHKGVNKHLLLLDCCREFLVKNIPRATTETWKEGDKKEFNITIGDGTVIAFATSPGDYASDGDSADQHKGASGHGTNQLSISSFARAHLSPA